MEIRVRRLEVSDDRSRFSSGNIELDRFFQRFAGQNQFRHYIGTTYIADAGGKIAGFATVTVGGTGGQNHIGRDKTPLTLLSITGVPPRTFGG